MCVPCGLVCGRKADDYDHLADANLDFGCARLLRRTDRAGDIGLSDVGGTAGHGSYREIPLSALVEIEFCQKVFQRVAKRTKRRFVVAAVDSDCAGRALHRGGTFGQRQHLPAA